jgi:hypothetical protein
MLGTPSALIMDLWIFEDVMCDSGCHGMIHNIEAFALNESGKAVEVAYLMSSLLEGTRGHLKRASHGWLRRNDSIISQKT